MGADSAPSLGRLGVHGVSPGPRRGATTGAPPRCERKRLGEVRNLPGVADELEDVHARVGPVDDDDVPPVVDVDVVGLDRDLAGRRVVVIAAPHVRVGRGGRDVERDLHRIEGIANIDSPHTGVEPREKHDAPVVDRREVLAARVGPEAAAHLTELLRGLRHLVVGNVERLRLGGDVSDVDELPVLLALVGRGLVGDDDEVADRAAGAVAKSGTGCRRTGNVVWAPALGNRSSLLTCGKRSWAGEGFTRGLVLVGLSETSGPRLESFRSLSRSTICSTPWLL